MVCAVCVVWCAWCGGRRALCVVCVMCARLRPRAFTHLKKAPRAAWMDTTRDSTHAVGVAAEILCQIGYFLVKWIDSSCIDTAACHMVFVFSAHCHFNVARRGGQETCTGHRADNCLVIAGFEPMLLWADIAGRRDSPCAQACAAQRRRPFPPGWTSLPSDRTHASSGVRTHARADWRLKQAP